MPPMSVTRPRSSRIVRAATARTRSWSWLSSRTAMPCAASRASSPASRSRATVSSPVLGSSRTTARGPQTSTWASATRCRCPPENWCGKRRRVAGPSGIPAVRRASAAYSAAA
ncbi:hypothetical protein [Streptomyces flavovirens]|uniref:hypothetical protein n=1 Tax=Streptomyces flavovirens TaxID=52258 RepID=UPI0031E8F71F